MWEWKLSQLPHGCLVHTVCPPKIYWILDQIVAAYIPIFHFAVEKTPGSSPKFRVLALCATLYAIIGSPPQTHSSWTNALQEGSKLILCDSIHWLPKFSTLFGHQFAARWRGLFLMHLFSSLKLNLFLTFSFLLRLDVTSFFDWLYQ